MKGPRTPSSRPTRLDVTATVLDNLHINDRHWRISLALAGQPADIFAGFTAGQFILLDVRTAGILQTDTYPMELTDRFNRHIILRRPFSPMQVDTGPDWVRLELLYRVVGPATARMTGLRPNDRLRILGPLGRGFTIDPTKTTALLVAGGIGLPPVYCLARQIARSYPHIQSRLLLGVSSAGQMPVTQFDPGLQVHVCSEDGSIGNKCVVTKLLSDWLEGYNDDPAKVFIAACGPEQMLAHVARIATSYRIDCQVSMERYMTCGIGLCQGCVVRCSGQSGDTYKLCCQDGPVFDAKEVIFSNV